MAGFHCNIYKTTKNGILVSGVLLKNNFMAFNLQLKDISNSRKRRSFKKFIDTSTMN